MSLVKRFAEYTRVHTRRQAMVKYSDEQPRDDRGQWTSGGGAEATNRAIDRLNEHHPANPDNPAERLLIVGGERVGSFEVIEREGRLRIRSIEADKPGQGIGSLILGRITRAADQEGAVAELTASSKGSHFLSTDQLKEWYGGRGFVTEPGTDPAYGYMIREPKAH